MHLPSLAVLRSFEAAAKHQSFTRAAEELHVTQGAVSRMARELEGWVGVPLFRPEGRGVALTEAGKHLAAELEGDLGRLRQTLRHAIAAGESGAMLTIAVPPTFGSRWLAPRLVQFRAENQSVQLAVLSRSHPFDLARSGVDLAIHFGRREWIDGNLTELCPEDPLAVASPVMAERFGLPDKSGLEGMPLLHLQTRPNPWPVYFDSLGLNADLARKGAIFDQFSTMISASIHGLGAAIVPSYLIEAELAQGTLVPLGHPPRPEDMYYVVTPKGVTKPHAETFRSWITNQAKASFATRRVA